MSTKKSNQKRTAKAAVEQPAVENPVMEQSAVEQAVTESPVIEQPSQKSPQSQVTDLKIVDIVPNPANPRKYFDEESLSELAQNIREHGVLQPVTVREIPESGGGKFEIVFGERRFRAAKIAGLETLPCMVRELNDDAVFDLMISENLARSDIRPSEEAAAFKTILDKGKNIAYISERFGKSEKFVHSRLSLVRLIPEITGLLDRDGISIGMAVEISKLEPAIQEHLCREHLETDVLFNNWKNLPLKMFKEKLEGTYTVLLSRFSFDKSECELCTFNTELHSLFPAPENSRCTRSACLVKKQESYITDGILAAIQDENAEVYINNEGGLHSEIIEKLGELGIEVKSGKVYPMPENPVMPAEEDFEDNSFMYERAQREFEAKQTKWNALQGVLGNGTARKVITMENLVPVFGYIMVAEKQNPCSSCESDESAKNAENLNDSDTQQNGQSNQSVTANNSHSTDSTGKPDLKTTFDEKDKKNRDAAFCKVIEDAKKLVKSTDIPPTGITSYEESLIFYIMLSDLDAKHFELFGIPQGKGITEDDKLRLYNSLTEEQKNIVKRDFLIKNMVKTVGVSKKSALLLQWVTSHFPVEMEEIMQTHNSEYQSKRQVIQEQLDKIQPKTEELSQVAQPDF